jgi:hypothetical protein
VKSGHQAPGYTSLQGKISSKQIYVKDLNFSLRSNLDRFRDSLKFKLDF